MRQCNIVILINVIGPSPQCKDGMAAHAWDDTEIDIVGEVSIVWPAMILPRGYCCIGEANHLSLSVVLDGVSLMDVQSSQMFKKSDQMAWCHIHGFALVCGASDLSLGTLFGCLWGHLLTRHCLCWYYWMCPNPSFEW